jgi:four helix bundle protein
MHNFRKLDVWSKAMEVAVEIIKLNETLPYYKRNGLARQLERSSVSVPSNIAEGTGRKSVKEYLHFLNIACASSYELETQVLIAQRVDFFQGVDLEPLILKIHSTQKMLFGLSTSILKSEK